MTSLYPTIALWVVLLSSHYLLGLGWIFSAILGAVAALLVDYNR